MLSIKFAILVLNCIRDQSSLYVSTYICLFVCPIITQEPLARWVSNFDWGTRESNGNVLCLEKIGKIVIYDIGLVNGGTNYDSSGATLGFHANIKYN